MSWLAPSGVMVWCGNRHRPGRAGPRPPEARQAAEALVGISPEFLAAVAATDFAPRYYELCRRHPLRLDTPACNAPAADILRAARAAGPATKFSGPGRAFGFEWPGGPAAAH